MQRALLAALALFAITACSPATQEPASQQQAADDASYRVMYTTTKYSFEDVAENLDLAITDRGFKIDNHAFIGRMLDRTAEAVGATKKVYEHAQQYRFCPSTYSYRMLSSDPHNIAFCPYVINFYHTPDDPKTVYVMFRRPLIVGSDESKAALQSVEDLLNELIQEALQ